MTEIPITLTRKDGSTLTMRTLGTNAVITLEEKLGRPFGTLLAELGVMGFKGLRMATVRAFLQAAITTPGKWTDDVVGDLIDDVGIEVIAKAISQVAAVGGPTPAAGPVLAPRRKRKAA